METRFPRKAKKNGKKVKNKQFASDFHWFGSTTDTTMVVIHGRERKSNCIFCLSLYPGLELKEILRRGEFDEHRFRITVEFLSVE